MIVEVVCSGGFGTAKIYFIIVKAQKRGPQVGFNTYFNQRIILIVGSQ